MTNLKPVTEGFNKFCGPTVLSILTGKFTDECAQVISRINGQHNVTGVQLSDLLKAADRMGFDTRTISPQGSLYRSLTTLVKMNGIYIITVPRHFVCIEVKDGKIYFCDNHTKEPIPAASSSRLMMPVLAINQVIERERPPEPPKPILTGTELKVFKHAETDGSFTVTINRVSKYDIVPDQTEELAQFTIKDDLEYSNFVNKIYRSLMFDNRINNG